MLVYSLLISHVKPQTRSSFSSEIKEKDVIASSAVLVFYGRL